MKNIKEPNVLVVGLALFSMFFGSGNLIFPLHLGAVYQSYFLISCLGFVITAVLLPTLGILAMIPAHGQYDRLFEGLGGQRIARLFFLIILAFWIPLGSGPRCVVLAHASIMSFLPINIPLGLFAIIFLLLTYICIKQKSGIIDILGKLLTPILLISIFLIVIAAIIDGKIEHTKQEPLNIFFKSIIDGYYTQDLIAAIFFSSALVNIINTQVKHEKQSLKIVFKAGIIAVLLLFVVYAGLMAASAIYGKELVNISGEKLVSSLAILSLGPNLGLVSSVAVSLACFTTEIALVFVFADFLSHNVFHKSKSEISILSTLFIIGMLSLMQFDGIMAIVDPAMKIIYPLLLILVVRFLILKYPLKVVNETNLT